MKKRPDAASVGLTNRRRATEEEIRSLPTMPTERSAVKHDGASWLRMKGIIYRIVEDDRPAD